MSFIHISDLTFCYDGAYENVFENVSFRLDTDWRIGFVGRNGRGKTTFFRLLMNQLEYSGQIRADVQFEYFPYTVDNKHCFTVDIIREIVPNVSDWEILKELSCLDFDSEALYRPFYTLSEGEQAKALLAALFLKENAFLLIDEPTNHLDFAAREKLAAYLKRKKGFILISHDRYILDECAEYILAINKCNIEVVKGNFSTWQAEKALRDAFEIKENERLKTEIKRLSKAAGQSSNWSDSAEQAKFSTRNSGLKPDRGYIGHKSAKMMKRAKNISKRQNHAVKEKSKLLKNIENNEALKLLPLRFNSGPLVQLHNVSVFYDDKEACSNISFTIESEDRIALKGKNGSGKSSILKLICGEKISCTGEIKTGRGLIISYVSQTAGGLRGSVSDYAKEIGIDESLLKAVLSKLGFAQMQFDMGMEHFSEGQKKKVLLAASLCRSAHLYVWDEPLNYIDVITRMQLEALLDTFKPTMIFTEHDKVFADTVSTKTIEI